MGLDTTHGCWHGAYSAFGRWRSKLAEVAGLPPLELMAGFWPGLVQWMRYVEPTFRPSADDLMARLPIRWECLKPDVLYVLLDHSDCEGELPADVCAPLADRLAELLPLLPNEDDDGHIGDWREKTQQFIDGLRLAASRGEAVEFG